MKVNLFVSKDIEEPHADIHTNELTDNITKAMSILESDDSNDMLAVKKGSDIALLEFSDVFMLRVEDKQVKVVLEMLAEGNTIPFIAIYRKEATGALDE